MASDADREYRGRIRIGRRRLIAIVLAAMAATIAAIAWPPERFSQAGILSVLHPLHILENAGYDALMAVRGREPDRIDPRIVILGIDSEDEATLGAWPFRRRVEAAVARNLVRDGAALVAFDILFSGPTDRTDDRALDAALRGPGKFVLTNRIVHGTTGQRHVSMETPYHDPEDPNGVDFEAHAISGFAEFPDEDHVVRAMAPVENFQDRWLPSFPVAAYMKLNGIDPDRPENLRVTDDAVYVGDLRIPRTGASANDAFYNRPIPFVRVDYPAAGGAFPMPAQFNQVALGTENPQAFRGKFVFVGVTGSQLAKQQGESFATSYSRFHPEQFAEDVRQSETPGVIIQALNFNALLHHTYVRETTVMADWGLVFLVSLLAVGIVRRFPNLVGVIGALSCVAGQFGFSLLCLRYRDLHVPWVVPSGVVLLSAAYVGWLESGAIRRRWAGYVSPAILEQILATEGGLGARRYDASVLFGDIRGFTSFSEQHSPETVVFLLNRHLERLTGIIAEEHGTIDKFLGDGILAVFGAPIAFAGSAEAAVRAAWRMREAATAPILDEEGNEHVLATGFGIATGPFLGGDIGSRRLKNWTVIGDVVNLASRLQGVTGQPDVIIDEATYRQVAHLVEGESLGDVALKGKAQPVRCYRVVAWSPESDIPRAETPAEPTPASRG